ncbi:MAG: exodeoxyribonuclease VII large subunit [Chitinophagales bacterium]
MERAPLGTPVYSVHQVTQRVRERLEDAPQLTNILVRGELSNFRRQQPSGHLYFTLKDPQAQLRCVMWRSRAQSLRFEPRDGMGLIAFGSLRVYEARGEYQLQAEEVWPDGQGDLFLAYTQLKARLEAEGLFSSERKRELPLLPRCVGVITSPVGAAVRDIIHVLRRRAPGIDILLAPAAVQGDEAPRALVAALELLAGRPEVEVIILGRGGGSFEELSAFNDERLARAIARCPVPVVSAVGHETDYTIADFVADVRAATPSAAAELVAPDVRLLRRQVEQARTTLAYQMRVGLGTLRSLVERLADSRALDLERRVAERAQELDSLSSALGEALARRADGTRRALDGELWPRLVKAGVNLAARPRVAVSRCEAALLARGGALAARPRAGLAVEAARLEALSPLRTLGRGYAVCRRPSGEVVKRAVALSVGDQVEVVLSQGALDCTVNGIAPEAAWVDPPPRWEEEERNG